MDIQRFAEKYVGKVIRVWNKEVEQRSIVNVAFGNNSVVNDDYLTAEFYVLRDVYEVPGDVMLELVNLDYDKSTLDDMMNDPDYIDFKMLSEIDFAVLKNDMSKLDEE